MSFFLRNNINGRNRNIQNFSKKDKNLIQKFTKQFKLPVPRINLGKKLAEYGLAISMTDISDGLCKDIFNVFNVAASGAEIRVGDLPVNENLKYIAGLLGMNDYMDGVISFGEDYELLWTAEEGASAEVFALSKTCGVKISKIGAITNRFKGIKFTKNNSEYHVRDITFKHL